jgi:hypothetical protein
VVIRRCLDLRYWLAASMKLGNMVEVISSRESTDARR